MKNNLRALISFYFAIKFEYCIFALYKKSFNKYLKIFKTISMANNRKFNFEKSWESTQLSIRA